MKPLQKAKAKMLIQHVFFASIVLSTEMVEDENIPTAATDMVKIYYNPQFIASLSDEVVMFVLAHEAMHIMLKHGLRVGSRNMKRWNIAADYAINLLLQGAGFKLWQHCYVDAKYTGMSAEQIYELLPKEECKGGQGGMGDDVMPTAGMDPETRAVVERRIDQRVAQAASVARMAGRMPAEIERLVDGILNPPLPWQDLLRDYMTQKTKDNMTWSRRDRRHPGIYLPDRWDQAMGEIVLAIDTSGSISDDDIAQVAAEIREIAEFVKPERIRVIWCDAAISGEQILERDDQIELHPKGGGGTDMRVVLEYAEQYDPVVVVLITDGYTPWGSEPSYPLISVITTNAPCPIGQVVRM